MTTLRFILSCAIVLLGIATHVSAQIMGISNVQCMGSFGWANNSLSQNPCLVTAYLQAQCAGGTFNVDPLQPGYHYIGPTNDNSTQNPCICSTPVYMLESACGACQNHTYITWSMWSSNCPADMLQEQGTYDQIIPSGTLVPHWAYLKPADYGDILNVNAAKLAGEKPESSQVSSRTTSSRSTTSTISSTSSLTTSEAASTTPTPSDASLTTTTTTTTTITSIPTSSGGVGSSTHAGAIAGGVVGGVVVLGLIGVLGVWLLRNRNLSSPSTIPSAQLLSIGSSTTQEMSILGRHTTGGSNATNGQYVTSLGHLPSPVSAGGNGGVPPIGPVYNPNDPSTFPQPYEQPPRYSGTPPPQQQHQPLPQNYYARRGPAGVGGPQAAQVIRYSGIPEV